MRYLVLICVFLTCACADTESEPIDENRKDQGFFMGVAFDSGNTMNSTQPRLDRGSPSPVLPRDMGLSDRDRYIPPLQPDVGVLTVEQELAQCVEQMTTFIENTSNREGCAEYPEGERMNPSSGYNQDRKTAACIHLTCEGRQLEGHNGIPAMRTCSQLNDLIIVLNRALMDAVEGGCPEPNFRIRVIDEADFMGGEPCDQITCGIDGDGMAIRVDNR